MCDWVVVSPPATWVQLHRLAPAACSDSAHLAVGLVDTIFALVEELELLVLTMPVSLTLTVHLLVLCIGDGRGDFSFPEVLVTPHL